MFRRLSNTLPPDPTFPTDLGKLGYFVNENDLIRQKANPKQGYQYKINRSERVNDAYKEAMNGKSGVQRRVCSLTDPSLLSKDRPGATAGTWSSRAPSTTQRHSRYQACSYPCLQRSYDQETRHRPFPSPAE